MKVLIACEESQAITIEMRKLGIEAYSCDIQECSGGHPEWHIQGDAIAEAYSGKYDMMIAHPPCTYLSNAGAVRLFRGGKLNEERYKKGLEAKDFFLKLLNAPIKYIAVENPVPSKIYELPKYSQIIQPFHHGHSVTKRTCFWLKNISLLQPTNIVDVVPTKFYQKGPKKGKPIDWVSSLVGGKNRQKERSKTFLGIAKAIAEQWGGFLEKSEL